MIKRYGAIGFFVAFLLASSFVAVHTVPEMTSNSRHTMPGLYEEVNGDKVGLPHLSGVEPLTGTMDPALVEQAGYIESENLSARTDTGVNTTYDLSIDSSNNWIGSVAEIDVWNLKKLYVINGTFDEGIPGSNEDPGGSVSKYPYGWDADSIESGSSSQKQFAEYNNQGQAFVSVENQGRDLLGSSYEHSQDTAIYWYQSISNNPYTTDFTLSLDYLYYRGPVDKPGGDTVSGDVVMFVQFAGTTVWTQSLPAVDGRGTWFSTGDISLPPQTVGSSFTFFIGIYFTGTMTLNAAADYDNDGAADGIANAASVSVQFDNVELSGQTVPDFAQVDLQFVADGTSVPISGSAGVGTAAVSNPSLWTTGPVSVEITSNDTVFFEYQTRLLSHRFINSSYTTDTSLKGVAYTIDPNQSPELNLFTYIGTVDPYEEFVVNIPYPIDWNNVTVLDPFKNDVTSQCSIVSQEITIPTDLVTRLGWWDISFDAPNYVKELDSQVYNQTLGDWHTTSEFRTSNRTRAVFTIGTPTEAPNLNDGVQVTHHLPNGTLWVDETVIGTTGQTFGSGRTFGPTNTSAGLWSLSVFWTNGTEIAYGHATLSLIHRAELSSVESNLDASVGTLVSNFIIFTDTDNGKIIVDEDAIITGNWTGGPVSFTPDPFKNWYETDLDTSLVGGGVFVVFVEGVLQYYDIAPTSFTVSTEYTASLNISNIGDLPVERGLDESFPVHFRYEYENGSGISGGSIQVDYTSTYTGIEEGTLADYGNGSYTLLLLANTSDTYSITLTASKNYHAEATDTFTIIVNDIATELIQLNGTADAIRFGNDYRVLLQYQNSSAIGLDGATVEVVSSTPSSGIGWTISPAGTQGLYEIQLMPSSADVFTLVFRASLINHEVQFSTFTLTVSEIATTLSVDQPLISTAFDQNSTFTLFFQDEYMNPIQNATLAINDLPSQLSIVEIMDWNNGSYTMVLQPLEEGAFDILVRAELENYQVATEAVSIFVTPIPSAIDVEEGISSLTLDYALPIQINVYFNRTDLGLPISEANISLAGYPTGFLAFTVEEHTGYYTLTIQGLELGKWLVQLQANKTGHRDASKFILIEVVQLDTTVEGVLPGITTYGRTTTLNFSYHLDVNSSRIRGATIALEGEFIEWVDYSELPNGQYAIEITPLGLGYHEIVLRFEKYGFETRSFTLTFTVAPVSMEVIFLEGFSGVEGSTQNLRVRVQEIDGGAPVSGALVNYRLLNSEGIAVEIVRMNETAEAGIYSALIVMPRSDEGYQLQIFIELANYELSGVEVMDLQSDTDLSLLIARTVNDNLIWIMGAFFLVTAVSGQKLITRRRRKQNLKDLAVKKRFDEARNVIGVIVLHKDSGIPLYSKILRGGIDESIIAAFITAIRNFRMEFDIQNGATDDTILPISDIIRVVTTESLVVAFITLNRPSMEQRRKMIAFSRKIGSVFDTEFESTPMQVLDVDTKQAIDTLFEEIMDGVLLRNYTIQAEEGMMKSDDCIITKVAGIGSVFTLDQLAVAIADCGVEELKTYSLIMEAIDQRILAVTEQEVTTDTDQFIADVESLLAARKKKPEEESGDIE